MCREWAEKEVGPQALEFNRNEKFNLKLFKRCGELGLPGVSSYHYRYIYMVHIIPGAIFFSSIFNIFFVVGNDCMKNTFYSILFFAVML